jgi:hypothetical protein
MRWYYLTCIYMLPSSQQVLIFEPLHVYFAPKNLMTCVLRWHVATGGPRPADPRPASRLIGFGSIELVCFDFFFLLLVTKTCCIPFL